MDFYYSCAYCSISEAEAATVAFEVDHYKPVATGEADVHEYSNLMYSCDRCNGFKSDYWPSKEKRERGLRLLRPDHDELPKHYNLSELELQAVTQEAEYTIQTLFLNSQTYRRLRRIRKDVGHSARAIAHGIQALADLRLDDLPPLERTRFARMRELFMEHNERVNDQIDAATIVRVLNKSELADADPERQKLVAARKSYLEQNGVFRASAKLAGEDE